MHIYQCAIVMCDKRQLRISWRWRRQRLKRVRSTVKEWLAYKQVNINSCLITNDVKYDSWWYNVKIVSDQQAKYVNNYKNIRLNLLTSVL